MLSPKSPAPLFSLPSTSGRNVSTKDLRGQRFVLYFYPRDDTPGCTREACDFRDNLARLGKAKIAVYGVSKDGIASHQKFRAKYGLPFELLSDDGNAVARKYGAFGQKMMYGKSVTGVIRSTFLVGADGKLERVWSPVKVDGHVDAVLAAIAEGSAPTRTGTIVAPRATQAKKPAVTPRSGALKAAAMPARRASGSSSQKSVQKSVQKSTARAAKKAPAARRTVRKTKSKKA